MLPTALLKALYSSAPKAPLSGEQHREHLQGLWRSFLVERCSLGCFLCSSEQQQAMGSTMACAACLVGGGFIHRWIHPLRPGGLAPFPWV